MPDIADLRRLLAAQEAKPKLDASSRQIIASLKPEIIRLHKELGWSWLEVADLLAQQGVSVSVNTLRNYVYTATPSRRAVPSPDTTPRRAKAARPPGADAGRGGETQHTTPAPAAGATGAGASPFQQPAPLTGRVNPILD